MASPKFPLSVAGKHQILFAKPLPPAELTAWGHRYQEAGLLHDALEFYQTASNGPALEALTASAVDGADLVLLLNACRALGSEPSAAQLESLRQRAVERGADSVVRRVAAFLAAQS